MIKIFTTGGTIDKIYFDAKSAFEVGAPQIGQLLEDANVVFQYEVRPIMQKDSLHMTDADRALIVSTIKGDDCQQALVTHGTDTMVHTARALGDVGDKTIVLVGSMQPARFRVTDAIFNIGYAIAALQLLPAGVYVAMNGQIFDPLTARKNVDENRFEQIAE
jgi:L-asparaginase